MQFEFLEPRRLLAAPIVSVIPRKPSLYEAGPTTRIFVIRRADADLSQPLSVFYTVGGKAKAGLDYNSLGDGITIKPGEATRRITVTAIDDSLIENTESITLTLNARSSYTIDASAPAGTMRIFDNDSAFAHPLSWSTVAAASTPRAEAMVAPIEGKILVFGGYTDGTATANGRVDLYDPALNRWTKLNTSMPLPTTHSGCAVVGHSVYLAGGYFGGSGGSQTFATTRVFKYNIDANAWAELKSLPGARGGGALVALDGRLHFFGGSDLSRSDRGDHWMLDLANPTQWTSLAPLPTLRNHLGGVVLNGKIYAIGGQKNQDANEVPQSAVESYDPATNLWTPRASLPFGRSHIAAATLVWNGRIVTFGGETTYLTSVNNVSAYDPASNTWSDLTALPGKRSSGIAAVIGTDVYYSGGILTTNTWKGVLG